MFRQLLLGAICLFCITPIFAQNARYYYADGERMSLNESTTSFILQTTNIEGLVKLVNEPNVVGFDAVEAFPHKGYAVVRPQAGMLPAHMIHSLGFSAEEAQISSAYSFDDGYTIYPTWRIVFEPKKEVQQLALAELMKYERRNLSERFGVYRQDIANLDEVFEVANALFETGLFEYAHPDFYAPITRYADPLFSQQFQMHNTGQTLDGVTGVADADCNALEAWGVTLGSSSTTVAVIDDGLEAHEDFVTSGGASRYTAGFSPANNGNGDAVSGSAHGVSCAGSISASHNNIGVQGVAPLANLISVNIFVGGESTQDIADGFAWAQGQGADVMSNSWGYTSCTANFSNINNAMSNANSNGRGGLGSVVVFASGNGYKSCVDYPGNQSSVIAVGAFSNQGIRSAYSNYGSALDIMAPSNNVGGPGAGVRTTDRMGSPGYNSTNYTSTFGGTSSACPVVAGVAALVLGYNAALTSTEVKNILYSTAIDMGAAGDDLEYANGRVNAYGAVLAAGGTAPTCSDGVQNGQETGVDCGGPDCPSCPSGCSNGTEVTLSITLDNYPEETSWTITNSGGGVVASGGTYGSQPDGSTITETICLADGCYDFTINDTYGDGICCQYGNGSYSLTDGGTTLASGGSFTSTETTNFCLGGPGPDTQAPTTPTNLSASGTTTTSTSLSWNASSDNVGVTGYNVYQNGSLLGSVTGTGANVTGLTPNTTYSYTVRAFDAAGNLSNASNSVSVTTLDDGPAPDTEAPTNPTNLTASNTTTNSTDLSWNASTDNVGVTGYRVYQGGSQIGTSAGTSYAVTGLSANTTYSFTVRAIDAAGNLSGNSNTATVTTDDDSPGGNPTQLWGHFFESGWDGWTDGGSDCFRYSGSRSWEGNRSIRLRDNSGTNSAMTSSTVDLASFDAVELKFYFYPNSMESGEDFWVRYNDGSGWQTIATYARGTSFENGQFYSATILMDDATYNLVNGARFRIQCDASTNSDQVYIDQITLIGDPVVANFAGNNGVQQVPGMALASGPEFGEGDVLISPNPASDLITVRAHDAIQEVSLVTIDGRTVLTQKVDGFDQTQVGVRELPAGVYMLSVTTEEEVITERVIVRR